MASSVNIFFSSSFKQLWLIHDGTCTYQSSLWLLWKKRWEQQPSSLCEKSDICELKHGQTDPVFPSVLWFGCVIVLKGVFERTLKALNFKQPPTCLATYLSTCTCTSSNYVTVVQSVLHEKWVNVVLKVYELIQGWTNNWLGMRDLYWWLSTLTG